MQMQNKSIPASAIEYDVTDMLREAIVNREEFAPGAPLRIDALSSRFGVSHMPIRAALQRLEGEGLITAFPNKGARVANVDQKFVSDLMDVRIMLESYLARSAAYNITPSQFSQLEELFHAHEQAVLINDVQLALINNRLFHAEIHRIAGNHDAILILDRHWRLIRALWSRYGPRSERFQEVVKDHRQLMAAFSRKDPEAAAAISAAHTVKAKQLLIEAMDNALTQQGDAL